MTERNRSNAWGKLSPSTRKSLVWGLWFITWAGLVCGLIIPSFYHLVVLFTALHTFFFWFLFRFRIGPFPVQVRLAYLAWVTVGTYVPHMVILLDITTIGLATNLFLDYCPLARLMSLMPWNRREPFSAGLVQRTFFSPPAKGRFVPPAGKI